MSPDTVVERVIELPATAAAATVARRELAAVPGVAGAVGYKILLISSELISSCVQDVDVDAPGCVWLSVRVTTDRVRVEVSGLTADLPGEASLRSRSAPSLGGMGLRIVDRMADAWGVEGEDDALVWFEVQR